MRAACFQWIVLLGLITWSTGVLAEQGEKEPPRANVVLFLADNLGYEDVSWLAKLPTTLTPHIDSIGANGLTLSHWNSAAHLCSASRAALLTGLYPVRTGVYPGVFHPDASLGLLPPTTTSSRMAAPTIATLLKERGGYATAMVGKWHLGHVPPHLPTHHGFDEYVGVPFHMSGGSVDNHTCAYDQLKQQWLPLYENEDIVEQPVNVQTLGARYVSAATNFIQRHAANATTPFFLYMAFSHVHQLCAAATGREQSTCQWSGTANSDHPPTFANAVAEMDWMVGEILSTVQSLGLSNDTIVLFTSDNGPWLAEQSCAGLAGPFRAQWLRDNVPDDCTACPHDYSPHPTAERPRRCQVWQPTRSTANVAHGDSANDVLYVDGVHCGADSGLGSMWEANLRMPALVSWPGHIVPNTTTSASVSSLDVVPTLLSLLHLQDEATKSDETLDGMDISPLLLGREHEYDGDNRALFFWRDGFLLDLAPLGPPYGRFDVVAAKLGRFKAWYWTKSSHYNADVEQYHNPPLLFDVLQDPAEAYPIVYPTDDESNFYVQLVHRIDELVRQHKKDVMASPSYPLTLQRDARNIPCVDPANGCRTSKGINESKVRTSVA